MRNSNDISRFKVYKIKTSTKSIKYKLLDLNFMKTRNTLI